MVCGILSEQLGEIIDVGKIWPHRFSSGGRDFSDNDLQLPWSAEYIGRAMDSLLGPAEQDVPGMFTPVPSSVLVSLGVDWLTATDRPPPARRCGEEVTAGAMELLAGRIGQLRGLDDAQGALVANWMAHDLRWAMRLARTGSYDQSTGTQLYRAIAELAQLAGWLLVDLGQRARGQRYLLAGLRAASLAGDRDLGAYILSCLSYHLVWSGNARDAVRLAKIARNGAACSSAGMAGSLLATRQARAHASLGEQRECQQALEEAAQAFVRPSPGEPPSWSSWVTLPVLEADAGRARLDLGDPRRAEQHLVTGIRRLDQSRRRDRMLHSMSVAEARLARGEVDGAAEVTRVALELGREIESTRARSRLVGLRAHFAGHDAVTAKEMTDDIDQVLAALRPSGRRL